ncbi:LytTR family DNA-binding domain-containing protein [Lactobacillus intestinalis]|uniref:LytR/AlgR family response regulator transcription factor n=1 Tax=Lactobacillus intestinalis TaxID=151781 RepID=UPI00262357E2|nr:LytTR family DNA-binding domain-containing protein [Lactobacillus intestinalis]
MVHFQFSSFANWLILREDRKIKYSVFICDDEQEQVNILKECIRKSSIILSDEDKLEFDIIKTVNAYNDAMNFIEASSPQSGIYFLDIEIGKKLYEKNGLDLAEAIKQKDKNAQLIFITSHQDMAFLTFKRKLGAVDFIVKNGDKVDLQKDINYALQNATQAISNADLIKKNIFSYKFGQEVRNIKLSDVIYITTTSVGHKLRVVKTTGWGDFIGKLKEIPEKYESLVQISQSCVINPENIDKVSFREKKIYFVNGDVQYFSVRNTHKMHTLFDKKV